MILTHLPDLPPRPDEMLRRFAVSINFVGRQLTFAEPSEPPVVLAGTTVLPITFSGNLPLVEGAIDGLPARMVIDSGDRSSLTLFKPFVEEHRLRQAYPRRFAAGRPAGARCHHTHAHPAHPTRRLQRAFVVRASPWPGCFTSAAVLRVPYEVTR